MRLCLEVAFGMGLVPLYYKRDPETPFPATIAWGHREKMAIYEPGSGLSLDIDSAAPWPWTSPELREISVFSPSVYGIPP